LCWQCITTNLSLHRKYPATFRTGPSPTTLHCYHQPQLQQKTYINCPAQTGLPSQAQQTQHSHPKGTLLYQCCPHHSDCKGHTALQQHSSQHCSQHTTWPHCLSFDQKPAEPAVCAALTTVTQHTQHSSNTQLNPLATQTTWHHCLTFNQKPAEPALSSRNSYCSYLAGVGNDLIVFSNIG
jgi:hypothetical protein